MSEIELKFVTRHEAHATFVAKVLPLFEAKKVLLISQREMRLENDYYDTPSQEFQKHKMGFRVRGNNGQYEQTLKTKGKVSGGLHERAEHNVSLSHPLPDLSLFDASVWPDSFPVEAKQSRLEKQFSTHFIRYEYLVEHQGSKVEVVIDCGEAATEKASSYINEIELELVSGEVTHLIALANIINQVMDVRLSDVSKAAQGYELLHGFNGKSKSLPAFLSLEESTSTEEAFVLAVNAALKHWQYHEHAYISGQNVKALGEIAKSVRLLLQSVSLYLPVLQCPALLSLHKKLIVLAQRWAWQDDLQSLRYLLSKKSLFFKTLSKHPAVTSYLQGRQAGLLHAHVPSEMFFDQFMTEIKLQAINLVQIKPWRNQTQGFDLPVIDHAKGWLSQGWQTVQQSMPLSKPMRATNYSAVEVLLRQTLWSGFLLGDLFVEARGNFRAPWLDLLTGIDELNALLMLKQALKDADLESQEELSQWTNDKLAILIGVMERTRNVAMQREIYW